MLKSKLFPVLFFFIFSQWPSKISGMKRLNLKQVTLSRKYWAETEKRVISAIYGYMSAKNDFVDVLYISVVKKGKIIY